MRDKAHTVSLESEKHSAGNQPSRAYNQLFAPCSQVQTSYTASTSPDLCCQPILDHIPDFIDSVATNRKQAIGHAKKKATIIQESQAHAESHSNAQYIHHTKMMSANIPTPTHFACSRKDGCIKCIDVDVGKQQVQDTRN